MNSCLLCSELTPGVLMRERFRTSLELSSILVVVGERFLRACRGMALATIQHDIYGWGHLEPMEKHPNFDSYLLPQHHKRNLKDVIFGEIRVSRIKK
jgi:hypothetical protein